MRFGLLILAVFLNTQSPVMQELRYDENGHIVFIDIVSTDLKASHLLANAQSLKEFEQTSDKKFIKNYVMTLYKKRLGKSPEGELTYTLSIELKENRYRYVFTDFVYHPLMRNRYGRFERKRNGSQSLEDLVSTEDKIWEGYKGKLFNKIDSSVEFLKSELTKITERPKEQQKVNLSDDW